MIRVSWYEGCFRILCSEVLQAPNFEARRVLSTSVSTQGVRFMRLKQGSLVDVSR